MHELIQLSDFKEGDVIKVISHERNCGIDQTVFVALVVESKNCGLLAIPQDFQGYFYRQIEAGAGWELEIKWLLENDVEITRLWNFQEALDERWVFLEKRADVDEKENNSDQTVHGVAT